MSLLLPCRLVALPARETEPAADAAFRHAVRCPPIGFFSQMTVLQNG
jgi:hypothetical protein